MTGTWSAVLCAGLWAAAPKTTVSGDALNRQGFAAYEKGDVEKAHKLFLKATARDPKHAFAWLNLARTTVLRSGGKEPEDPCGFDRNWVTLGLAHLDRAMQLDPKAVREKIEADTRGLAALKAREEYAAWRLALDPPPRDEAGLRAFLAAHNFFWAAVGVIEGLTLEGDGRALYGIPGMEKPLGTWTIRAGTIEISSAGKVVRRYRLGIAPFAFGEGAYAYRRVVLEQDGTQDGPDLLEYGPMVDCGD